MPGLTSDGSKETTVCTDPQDCRKVSLNVHVDVQKEEADQIGETQYGDKVGEQNIPGHTQLELFGPRLPHHT